MVFECLVFFSILSSIDAKTLDDIMTSLENVNDSNTVDTKDLPCGNVKIYLCKYALC